MRRVATVLIVGFLLVLGVGLVLGLGIGMGARVVSNWGDSRAGTVAGSGAVVVGPTLAPPTQVAAAPPATLVPTRPVPTATLVPRDVVVEVTESQMETQLNSLLVGQSLGSTPLGDARVQSVTVQLRDSLIRVGGGAKAGFLQAPFLAAGTVVPNGEGRPVVKVSQASVGGVELPEAARTALADSLQSRVDEMLGDRSVKIRTIDISDGKMRVVGSAGS